MVNCSKTVALKISKAYIWDIVFDLLIYVPKLRHEQISSGIEFNNAGGGGVGWAVGLLDPKFDGDVPTEIDKWGQW